MLVVFVIPAKQVGMTARQSESRRSRRNLDHAWLNRRHDQVRHMRFGDFVIEWQLVQHVGQRLRVHQAMFDRNIQQLVRVNFLLPRLL